MLDMVLSAATEVFGRPVAPTDDFVGLGADSMMVLSFLAILEERTGREFELQSLLDADDFADLANQLSFAER
jgi:acyl carrier protein